jgi:hypothetical protein
MVAVVGARAKTKKKVFVGWFGAVVLISNVCLRIHLLRLMYERVPSNTATIAQAWMYR